MTKSTAIIFILAFSLVFRLEKPVSVLKYIEPVFTLNFFYCLSSSTEVL